MNVGAGEISITVVCLGVYLFGLMIPYIRSVHVRNKLKQVTIASQITNDSSRPILVRKR